jgi:hypothetical protein
MPDIFISYSRRDKDFVERLHQALTEQRRDVWVDWEDIPSTAEWLKEIYAGIEQADTFAFVISPDSVTSEICTLEINYAIDNNKRLIPIMHRDLVEEQHQAALHSSISSHNWVFFRDTDDFDQSLEALVKALDTDLEYLRAHTRLLVRAVEWNDKNRDNSFILHGQDLRDAQHWLKTSQHKNPQPTDLQRAYIETSRKVNVNRRRAVILTAIYGFIVLILAIFAIFQAINAENRRQEADEQRQLAEAAEATAQYSAEQARSLALASNAQQALYRDNDPGLAIALALVANQIDEPSPLAQSVLVQAGYAPGTRILKTGHAVHNTQVSAHPEATTALAVSADNELVWWDLQTGDDLQRWPHDDLIRALSFSPDGQSAAVVTWPEGMSGMLTLYDLETGEMTAQWDEVADSLDIAFTPDGREVFLGASTGEVIQYDLETGEELQRFEGHTTTVRGISLSADGGRLATSSEDGTVRVWDVQAGEEASSINLDRGQAWAVAISPDGSHVLGGYEDNSLH